MFKFKKEAPVEMSTLSHTRVCSGVVEGINALVAIRKELMSQGAGAEVIAAVEAEIAKKVPDVFLWECIVIPKDVAEKAKVLAYVKG